MVAGCPKSEDGEHYGIEGKLIKYSIYEKQVKAHYLGVCEFCGCPIHFSCWMYASDEFSADRLEEEHITGFKEVYVDD